MREKEQMQNRLQEMTELQARMNAEFANKRSAESSAGAADSKKFQQLNGEIAGLKSDVRDRDAEIDRLKLQNEAMTRSMEEMRAQHLNAMENSSKTATASSPRGGPMVDSEELSKM